jgi:hypothetical protein
MPDKQATKCTYLLHYYTVRLITTSLISMQKAAINAFKLHRGENFSFTLENMKSQAEFYAAVEQAMIWSKLRQ